MFDIGLIDIINNKTLFSEFIDNPNYLIKYFLNNGVFKFINSLYHEKCIDFFFFFFFNLYLIHIYKIKINTLS